MDWKKDRERLRAEIRKHGKKGGMKATFLYVLISHMRGKIHMRYYKKYEGGWQGWKSAPERDEIPKEFTKAYGEFALQYYNASIIETLADQETWIKQHMESYKTNEEMFELAERVISAYNNKEAMTA